MDMEELYGKVFELRKTKSWKELEPEKVFAIHDGERMSFVHVLQDAENNFGVAVHAGEKGVIGFLRAVQKQEGGVREKTIQLASMNVLRLVYMNKDQVPEEVRKGIQQYAKKQGVTLRGQNAFPILLKIAPFRPAVQIKSEADIRAMETALSALLWVAEKVKKKELIIEPLEGPSHTIPLLRKEGDAFTVEEIPCPEVPRVEYPVGYTENEILKARVKKLKKQGKWACEVILRMVPSPAEGTDEIIYPFQLLTIRMKGGREVEVQAVRDYETRTNVMIDKLMEAMVRENMCPQTIIVSDERTERLLREWCGETGIALQRVDEQPDHLRKAEERILQQEWQDAADVDEEDEVSEADLIEHLETLISILELSKEMPASYLDKEMVSQQKSELIQMMKDPCMTARVRTKSTEVLELLDSLIDRAQKEETSKAARKKQRGKNLGPEKSYVISVSLDTGCYRHIQISSHALLVDLSDKILSTFEFDDDHAHAFFMDNRSFSWNQAYYMEGFEDGNNPTTNKVTLEETGLRTGQKFKYVFDFGDEWTFQCRLLRVLDEKTEVPRIVRSKGTPPSQYGYWDDDDDDDDYDDDDEYDDDD